MRIGLVCSVGITLDAFFCEIVDSWRAAGATVAPLAGTPASLPGSETIDGLTRNPAPANLRARAQLREWQQRHRLDVVITNTATASALVRMAGLDCPVVYFCHGLHWSAHSSTARSLPWRAIERALLPRTDGVLVLNTEDLDWFERRSEVPVRLVRHGVGLDTTRFARSPLPEDSSRRLLWIGELSDRKDPEAALAVVAGLRDRGVDVELDLLGDGPREAGLREQIAADPRLRDRVRLRGRTDVLPFLQRCHAVLHTAQWEGLSRALLEAVAVGRPVLGYDVKGVRDVPGALVSKPGDTAALVGQVAAVLADPAAAMPGLDPELLSYSAAAAEVFDFARDIVAAASEEPRGFRSTSDPTARRLPE